MGETSRTALRCYRVTFRDLAGTWVEYHHAWNVEALRLWLAAERPFAESRILTIEDVGESVTLPPPRFCADHKDVMDHDVLSVERGGRWEFRELNADAEQEVTRG